MYHVCKSVRHINTQEAGISRTFQKGLKKKKKKKPLNYTNAVEFRSRRIVVELGFWTIGFMIDMHSFY